MTTTRAYRTYQHVIRQRNRTSKQARTFFTEAFGGRVFAVIAVLAAHTSVGAVEAIRAVAATAVATIEVAFGVVVY